MSASAAPLPKSLESEAVHPVDEVLPAPRLIALGIQHVLVMYAGAVAVPLIVGAAVKAPREQSPFSSPVTCWPAASPRCYRASASGDSAFACRSSWV
jgi:Permease family